MTELLTHLTKFLAEKARAHPHSTTRWADPGRQKLLKGVTTRAAAPA
jgi:hypothetical protein